MNIEQVLAARKIDYLLNERCIHREAAIAAAAALLISQGFGEEYAVLVAREACDLIDPIGGLEE